VTVKPFLLRPDLPDEGAPRQARPGEIEGQLNPHLREVADATGLTKMKRPPWTSNSQKALQAAEYAREQGKYLLFHEVTYKAYWEDGKNIGDMAVLQELVEEAGMEWAPVKEALDEGKYWTAVMAQYQEAQDLGFNGIPAFVIGGFGFTGAQPMEVFRMVANKAIEAMEAPEDEPVDHPSR